MGRARIIADLVGFSTDSGVITFGTDKEITLTHDPDDGLILKHAATADDSFPELTLQTGDTDIAANDKLGQINFQAPDEGTGTDAILVAASIAAVSEGDFSSSSNATKLSFATGASELAAEKMSLSSDGNLTVSGTINGSSLGTASSEFSNLFLADAGIIYFGSDQDIQLKHKADVGLEIKNTNTADDKPTVLTLASGETDIAANDVIGAINFQAPDEGTGTDAILVAAGIEAVSEGDFSSSSNATKLSFKTGASEAAAEKMSLSSAGLLTIADDLVIKDGGTIGVASDADAITIASNGAVTLTQALAGTSADFDGGITIDNITIDGTEIDLSSGDLTVDVAGDISLDADGGDIFFKDAGTTFGSATNTSGNLIIKSGTTTAATFSGANVTLAGTVSSGSITSSGNILIADSGTIGSASDADAIAISSGGGVTVTQTAIFSAGMSVKNGSTSAGFVEFFEDSDNGTNKVTLVGPASTADVTVVLPTAAGTVATTDDATALAIALG